MRTQIRMACASIPVMTLMQAERVFTKRLDYVCTCGVNLNITDKPENNNFIGPYMTLSDLLSQVIKFVIL